MDTTQITEHMEVVGSCGNHVGTVDHVKGDRIKLTKNDSPDGQHHYLMMSAVKEVRDGKVWAQKNHMQTIAELAPG